MFLLKSVINHCLLHKKHLDIHIITYIECFSSWQKESETPGRRHRPGSHTLLILPPKKVLFWLQFRTVRSGTLKLPNAKYYILLYILLSTLNNVTNAPFFHIFYSIHFFIRAANCFSSILHLLATAFSNYWEIVFNEPSILYQTFCLAPM